MLYVLCEFGLQSVVHRTSERLKQQQGRRVGIDAGECTGIDSAGHDTDGNEQAALKSAEDVKPCMLIVRFYVGTKEEDAIIQTYNKLYSNFGRIPPGVSQPVIKVRSINDVPIMALTLWGKNYDSYHLRRIAGELENSLKQLDDVSETTIIGGQPREVRVVLDTQRLAAYGLTPGAVAGQLQSANSRGELGRFGRDNR